MDPEKTLALPPTMTERGRDGEKKREAVESTGGESGSRRERGKGESRERKEDDRDGVREGGGQGRGGGVEDGGRGSKGENPQPAITKRSHITALLTSDKEIHSLTLTSYLLTL